MNNKRFLEVIKESMSGLLPVHTIENIAPKVCEKIEAEGVIMPPCKVGDTVYIINEQSFGELKIVKGKIIGFEKGKEWPFIFIETEDIKTRAVLYSITSIGGVVFLSQEKAEDTLEKMLKYQRMKAEEAEQALRKEDEGK